MYLVNDRRGTRKQDARVRAKLEALLARLESRSELDLILDADPMLKQDPEQRAAVRERILDLAPHLRESA